jgi:uncharacterized membrane protein YfcA
MDELSLLGIAYFVFIMVFSFAMRGSAGFGGLNAPLLLIILPAKVIVPALVMLGVLSSLAIVARDHAHIKWRAVAQTLPSGIAGVAVGVLLFKNLEAGAIEKGLGFFILGYGIYALVRLHRPPQPLRIAPGLLAAVMGATGGLVGTMFGALAGVFVAVFLDILDLPKREFRATMAATLMLMGIARTLGYWWAGAITGEVLIAFGAALPLMGLGVILGNRLHARLNQIGFSRLVGVLFVLIGGFLLVR